MAIAAAHSLVFLSVVTVGTVFEIGLSVVFTGGVTIGTFHAEAGGMGRVRKLDVVEGNGSLFDSHVAERSAGDVGPGFLGFVALVDGCLRLLCLAVCNVKEFDRVLDIVDTSAEKNVTEVVAGLVEKGPGLLRL